ncbi:hypothetical protein JOB18_047793 [Solea senegalensis]|uniref:Uncharacterized protein n=1 Tax=Solea senegalensis TaxID=28829 RepID=A0AAV6S3C7_SOLSE|nr:hypothetical protein JOB18_047793 [Solea senegalensis]
MARSLSGPAVDMPSPATSQRPCCQLKSGQMAMVKGQLCSKGKSDTKVQVKHGREDASVTAWGEKGQEIDDERSTKRGRERPRTFQGFSRTNGKGTPQKPRINGGKQGSW